MQKADYQRDLDTIASDPDQGKSNSLQEPVPGHGQADLLDGNNPVPGLNDKPDSKNFKTPDRNKTSSDPDSGKTEYIAILIQDNKTKVNIGYIMKKMRKQRTQSQITSSESLNKNDNRGNSHYQIHDLKKIDKNSTFKSNGEGCSDNR